jgi:hypothetical protein
VCAQYTGEIVDEISQSLPHLMPNQHRMPIKAQCDHLVFLQVEMPFCLLPFILLRKKSIFIFVFVLDQRTFINVR